MRKLCKSTEHFLQKEIDPAFRRRATILVRELDALPGMKVLDVGCGRGFYETLLSIEYSKLQLTGIDSNDSYLKQAQQRNQSLPRGNKAQFLKEDAAGMKFKNGSFDRVICTEVLEHIGQDETVLKEIRRVLKKGGIALFSVPVANYPFLWDPANFILERAFGAHLPSRIWWLSGIWADHIRLYTENALLNKLKNNGLFPVNVWRTTQHCLPFAHFLLYGIGKNLVESGLVGGSFNRFEAKSPPTILHKLVTWPFNFFDKYNHDEGFIPSVNEGKSTRFLNLVVAAKAQ